MEFTKISYEPLGDIVARVNRLNGELEVNPDIWKQLPDDYRDFVLFHEEGHLKLQTRDEYAANNYAAKRFIHSTLQADDIDKRIVILSEIMSNEGRRKFRRRDKSNMAVDPISAVAGMVGDIFSTLPAIGIGSKGRQKEADAMAKAQQGVINSQAAAEGKKAQNRVMIIVLGGSFLVVILVIYFILKKR